MALTEREDEMHNHLFPIQNCCQQLSTTSHVPRCLANNSLTTMSAECHCHDLRFATHRASSLRTQSVIMTWAAVTVVQKFCHVPRLVGGRPILVAAQRIQLSWPPPPVHIRSEIGPGMSGPRPSHLCALRRWELSPAARGSRPDEKRRQAKESTTACVTAAQ